MPPYNDEEVTDIRPIFWKDVAGRRIFLAERDLLNGEDVFTARPKQQMEIKCLAVVSRRIGAFCGAGGAFYGAGE